MVQIPFLKSPSKIPDLISLSEANPHETFEIHSGSVTYHRSILIFLASQIVAICAGCNKLHQG